LSMPKTKKDALFFYPVFFEPSLLEAIKKKPYTVKMSTRYLGAVHKGNKWFMPFGISPKGYVHFWLGDLLENLNVGDIEVFMKYSATPDRLGKHFTRTQLNAEFVGNEDEN